MTGDPGLVNALLVDGVRGNGVHDDTNGLQAALDSGAGTIYLPSPPKNYLISRTLKIHSGQTLRADRFAVIRLKDQSNDEMLTNADYGRGNENIRIEGGIWDGNNAGQTRGNTDISVYDPELFTGTVLRFNHVKNLQIVDVTVRDPESFGIQIGNIDQFTVEDITFDYNMLRPNMDGVHCNGPCIHGRISNIKGATNDDMVALNADDGAWGEMTRGPIRNIVIDTVSCENGYTGVRLLSAGSLVSRIRISNIMGTYRYYAVSFTHHSVHPGAACMFEDIAIDGIFSSKPKDSPPGPFLWMESGAVVESLNVRNFMRTETESDAPGIFVAKGVTVKYMAVSDSSMVNKTAKPVMFFWNQGTIERLNMMNIYARAQGGEPRGYILYNEGTISQIQAANIAESNLSGMNYGMGK